MTILLSLTLECAIDTAVPFQLQTPRRPHIQKTFNKAGIELAGVEMTLWRKTFPFLYKERKSKK